jgi:hypothetical protein
MAYVPAQRAGDHLYKPGGNEETADHIRRDALAGRQQGRAGGKQDDGDAGYPQAARPRPIR